MAGILRAEKDVNRGINKVNDRIRSYLGFNDLILIENIRQLIMQVIFKSKSDDELARRYQIIEEQRRLK